MVLLGRSLAPWWMMAWSGLVSGEELWYVGGLTVEMVCAADVVAWDDGDEGGSAVGGGGLYATESVGLDCSGRAVAVAPCLYAGVYTGGVGSPKLNVGIRHRLTTGNVDHVDVEMSDGTLLAGEDI
jgi:hypothetical protein